LIRLVATLVSAIQLSRPRMPPEEAMRYAKVLNEVAKERDFDPLIAVAIIHFETQWRPNMVSGDGEDYGLGQVRARYVGACRGDEDPSGRPSQACRAVKASLLDGEHNIRVMGRIIEANQNLCKYKTGTAKAHQWLAGYQGRNFPGQNRWCQAGEKTWRVLSYHEELIATLLPKPPTRTAKPPRGHAPASSSGNEPAPLPRARPASRVAQRASPPAKR
jgi:hypothetical protein